MIHIGKCFQKLLVSFFCGECQAVYSGTLQGQEAFLMYDTPPVGQFYILLVEMIQYLYGYGIGPCTFHGFYKFKSGLVVIETQQAEGNVSLSRKPGGVLLSVDDAVGAGQPFFYEIHLAVYDPRLDYGVFGRKTMFGQVFE